MAEVPAPAEVVGEVPAPAEVVAEVPAPAEVMGVVLDPAPAVTGVVEVVWVVLCPTGADVELPPGADAPDEEDPI